MTAFDLAKKINDKDPAILRLLTKKINAARRAVSRRWLFIFCALTLVCGLALSVRERDILPLVFAVVFSYTFGSVATFESGAVSGLSACAMDSSHFVIAFVDNDDSFNGKVIAGSVSGDTITITLDGASNFDTSGIQDTSVFCMDSSHFVIAFNRQPVAADLRAIAGTLSGTTITITANTSVLVDTSSTPFYQGFAFNTGQFLIVFSNMSDTGKGYAIGGSLSGVTITMDPFGNTKFENGLVSAISACRLDNTYFAISFVDNSDSGKSKVIIGSHVNITLTITVDSATTFENGGSGSTSIARVDDTHFIIAFDDFGDSQKGKVIAGSRSSYTITISADSGSVFSNNIVAALSLAMLDANYFVIAYQDNTDSDKLKLVAGSVSGVSISITADSGQLLETGPGYGLACVPLDATHFVAAFSDTGDSSKGKCRAGHISYTTISPNRTSRKNFSGYLAFVQQFVRHKLAGTQPWASPGGDLMP